MSNGHTPNDTEGIAKMTDLNGGYYRGGYRTKAAKGLSMTSPANDNSRTLGEARRLGIQMPAANDNLVGTPKPTALQRAEHRWRNTRSPQADESIQRGYSIKGFEGAFKQAMRATKMYRMKGNLAVDLARFAMDLALEAMAKPNVVPEDWRITGPDGRVVLWAYTANPDYPTDPWWVETGFTFIGSAIPGNPPSVPWVYDLGYQYGYTATHPKGAPFTWTVPDVGGFSVIRTWLNTNTGISYGWFDRSYNSQWWLFPPTAPLGTVHFTPKTDGWIAPVAGRFPMPKGSARPGVRKVPQSRSFSGIKQEHWSKFPKKQRDKKALIGGYTGKLLKGISNTTEALDFINVVYKSILGGASKRGIKTPQDKLRYIWENKQHLDPASFIGNLVQEQLTDYAYGRLGQISKRASQNANRPVGFQAGDWDGAFSYHSQGAGFEVDFDF